MQNMNLIALWQRRYGRWLIWIGSFLSLGMVQQGQRWKNSLMGCQLSSSGNWIRKLSYLMSNSDIFLWPAIDEAYGMSLLEAQFNGLPVIAGDNGGVGDIVRENKTGVLTPVGDVKAFADAISLLSADKARLAKMGSAAIKIMNEEHSIDYLS